MILYCYGTRPEYLKIHKIISQSTNIPHKILFTSQHENIVYGEYDFILKIKNGKNRLDSIISSILSDDIEDMFKDIKYVLVQGDTATAFAVALSAYHRNIKIIHLESGLRTYDKLNPYPEESYRQFISKIADIHLCPTETNKQNLINEKTQGKMFVVGNSVLDNLTKDNITYEDYVLITLHRRENHEQMENWFKSIEDISLKFPNIKFILPIHPNPNVIKHKHILNNVQVVDPMNHSDLISLIKKCKLIISDSGGIQEEASFLNKKVIVCRTKTERTESLGLHSFMCKKPEDLTSIFNDLIYNFEVNEECPYGDGNSVSKIINLLEKL